MTKLIRLLPIIMALVLIFACGGSEPTLDCSSPEAFANSSAEMMKYLAEKHSVEDQGAFAKGMLKITMAYSMSKQELKVLKKYDGWTLSQVIKHGR